MSEAGRQDSQTIALEVELPQSRQLSYLLGDVHQLVVSESEDPQVLHVFDVGTQMLKFIIAQVESPARIFVKT